MECKQKERCEERVLVKCGRLREDDRTDVASAKKTQYVCSVVHQVTMIDMIPKRGKIAGEK